MRLKIAALVFIAIVASGGAGFSWWWQHNRISFWTCFVTGAWEGGPGYEKALRQADARSADEDLRGDWGEGRYSVRATWLDRHTPRGRCGELSAKKHWAEVERTAKEMNWGVSHYFLAERHGYGDSYMWKKLESGEAAAAGNAREVNAQLAITHLKTAATLGLSLAQRELGKAYEKGEWGLNGAVKIPRNPQQSAFWLKKAKEAREKHAPKT